MGAFPTWRFRGAVHFLCPGCTFPGCWPRAPPGFRWAQQTDSWVKLPCLSQGEGHSWSCQEQASQLWVCPYFSSHTPGNTEAHSSRQGRAWPCECHTLCRQKGQRLSSFTETTAYSQGSAQPLGPGSRGYAGHTVRLWSVVNCLGMMVLCFFFVTVFV